MSRHDSKDTTKSSQRTPGKQQLEGKSKETGQSSCLKQKTDHSNGKQKNSHRKLKVEFDKTDGLSADEGNEISKINSHKENTINTTEVINKIPSRQTGKQNLSKPRSTHSHNSNIRYTVAEALSYLNKLSQKGSTVDFSLSGTSIPINQVVIRPTVEKNGKQIDQADKQLQNLDLANITEKERNEPDVPKSVNVVSDLISEVESIDDEQGDRLERFSRAQI